ncbi:hypothetical protein YC2023_098675 [Brassica napus]
MRRSILSRVNTCYPNNGSGSRTCPFLPLGQFRLKPSKIVSAPAIQAQGQIKALGLRKIFPIIFRSTRPTKVLLPQSCPIDLEGISNGSTEATCTISTNCSHSIDIESGPSPEDRTLIPRTLQVPKDKSTGPTGSGHEALIRDYEFLHDVRRYLRVVRQRIGLHASIKGLFPPEEGMRIIAVFTRLLPSTKLLHPRVRAYVLQKIILQPISNHGGT